MTGMREFWVNVYVEKSDDGIYYCWAGRDHPAHADARSMEGQMRAAGVSPKYRIHVRLKPEGAPKRYASEANRDAWEVDPEACRAAVRHFHMRPEGVLL